MAELADIKLFQGDCFELLKEITDESIDLILTDIPFNISRKNNFSTMKDRTGRNGIDFGEWDKSFDESMLSELSVKIKSGGSLVLFHAFEQYSKLRSIFDKTLVFKDRLIWEKTNPMPRNRDRRYISNIEMASWYVKPKSSWTFHRQSKSYDGSVMKFPSESGGRFKRWHPCQKNLNMIQQLVCRHSNVGDVVFDPFMGSGSTGVACVNTDRNFIGIELDEKYFEIAKQRIDEAKAVTQWLM